MENQRLDFAEFYRSSRDDCLRAVLVVVGDYDSAQEAVAEAFVRACASWRAVSRHPNPAAWVARTALNVNVSRWRRRHREVPASDLAALADTPAAGSGVQDLIDPQIMSALARLPARQRQVIALRLILAQDTIPCGSADDAIGISVNAKAIADQLRSRESCGLLKADGTATVGGVTAIRLTEPTNDGVTASWYVNSATYLPIRRTVTQRGVLLSTDAFQWLPRTAANLARLSLPVAPRGFAQVANAASATASLVLGAFAHRPLPGRG
jgi:RNA polymerase sigma-70 factor (ECF subfamily)